MGRREKRKAKKKDKKRKAESGGMVHVNIAPKLSPNFDFCACLRKKVVKPASSEMQGRVLHFKCGFDWFEAILADSRPENVKNVLKMGFFGKTPGVNGLT